MNNSLSCGGDIAGHFAAGFCIYLLGVKVSYITAFLTASAGGILLVIFYNASGTLIAVFVLFARFGISFAFNLSYLATPQMFPVALCTTAFGICNLFARFLTILSPIIAEAPNPIPMSIFSVFCLSSAFLPLLLRKVKTSD